MTRAFVAAAAAAAVAAAAAAVMFVRQASRRSSVSVGLLGSRPTVVLFGDSITQYSFQTNGWGASVADLLSRRCDVLNRGFGGYTTRWARYILPTLFPEGAEPHLLVTCWFGANDAASEDQSTHVPLDEYAENLRHILSHLKRTARHVVLLTPPPVHGPTRLAFQKRKFGDKATGVLERTTERAGAYAREAMRVADELSVPYLDVHNRMYVEPDWPTFVGAGNANGDGLHLSEEGQEFVSRLLLVLLIEVMGLPISPYATPQARMLVDVPWLPIDQPLGIKLHPVDYLRQFEEHQRRVAMVRAAGMAAGRTTSA